MDNSVSLQKILVRSTSVSNVDLSATCLVSGLPISIGIICSVCLSIFSLPAYREMMRASSKCATCGTRWKINKKNKTNKKR
jgi:hypothetical protein